MEKILSLVIPLQPALEQYPDANELEKANSKVKNGKHSEISKQKNLSAYLDQNKTNTYESKEHEIVEKTLLLVKVKNNKKYHHNLHRILFKEDNSYADKK